MPSLTWYVNRLGRMSPAEIVHRTLQAARTRAGRLVESRHRAVPEARLQQTAQGFVAVDAMVDAGPYVRRADAILADEFSFFGLRRCHLGQPPQWNRDPLTGRVAPLSAAATLDYRDERLVGNIKYLWEPNRHLHLPTLAQAYVLSGDAGYLDAIRTHVASWLDQCPYGRGAQWASSLELGIRLINWSITWQLLGGAESKLFAGAQGEAFRRRWLESVFQHVRSIMGKLSRYSSANNHLIGEVAGVWIAAVTWNCWPQMQAWSDKARKILIAEALKQNASDGGNREQAFSYQQFVLDFLLLAGLAGRAAGRDFGAEYWARMEKMMEFIAAMTDVAGNVPMVGDADDGYVVDLSAAQTDNYRSLLATGALLFDRTDLAAKAGGLDDKTRWLLGDAICGRWEEVARAGARDALPRAFPESGYYILGDRFDAEDEIRMLVDAGPLGYLSLAAHGHADALSVVLNVGGHEVLVDPGTYAYHTEPQWRRYFRSTAAHNTVSVDDRDQSCQSGNFMWSQHAHAQCLVFDCDSTGQRFVGEHDGYRRQGLDVTHRRAISFDSQERCFEIVDEIDGERGHEIRRYWHFAETLSPVCVDGTIEVEAGRFCIRLVPQEPVSIQSHRAGDATQGGWISRRFDDKVPATTFVWRNTIQGKAQLRTRIEIRERRQG